MKLYVLILLPLFIALQGGGCSSDDDGGNNNSNYITFLGDTNEAFGGCNVQSDDGLDVICVYSAFYQEDGLSYTIAISHLNECRTGTFNIRDDFDNSSDAYFVLQIAENGVAIETYLGFSGTVDLVETGTRTSMRFEGTIINTVSGEEETIEGFIECAI